MHELDHLSKPPKALTNGPEIGKKEGTTTTGGVSPGLNGLRDACCYALLCVVLDVCYARKAGTHGVCMHDTSAKVIETVHLGVEHPLERGLRWQSLRTQLFLMGSTRIREERST